MLNIGLRLTSTGYSRKLLEENIRYATSGGVGGGGARKFSSATLWKLKLSALILEHNVLIVFLVGPLIKYKEHPLKLNSATLFDMAVCNASFIRKMLGVERLLGVLELFEVSFYNSRF